MQDEKRVKVEITTKEEKREAGGRIHIVTSSDALKKAGLFYAGSLGLAFVCVFIPLIHFVAVPAILLLGPVVAVVLHKFYKGKKDILVEDAQCPHCHKELQLTKVLETWPIRENCSHCQTLYTARYIS